METRRQFIRKIIIMLGAMMFPHNVFANRSPSKKITKDVQSSVFRATNGGPASNLTKVIEMMGGIEKYVGENDIVVIKPNVQWWNQGGTNLAALKAFVDLIMNRTHGFRGEVVFAENVHRGDKPWESKRSGWQAAYSRNSDLLDINDFTSLGKHLKDKYGDQFSICHWIDVSAGGKRVYSPTDGVGYVYCDGTGGVPLLSLDNGGKGKNYREVIMTYPIFRTDKGTVIDFKNGIWEKGTYTEQPLRFVNFPALNHHSRYCGATSALKNYFGVTDISGGPEGPSATHNGGILTGNYYNFHQFAYNTWEPGPVGGMLGAEVGTFLTSIRKADLNITTAEWVGLISRAEPPVAHTRTILASTDAVALDYHSTKYVLYPNSNIGLHNPDNESTPLGSYLSACAKVGGGIYDESKVEIVAYDFKKGDLMKDNELMIFGDKVWGSNFKLIMKYFAQRYY